MAPHAQSKVRVPRGLDLHAQIHEPPPEVAISPSAPPPAEAAGQDMHAPRAAGGGGYGGGYGGGGVAAAGDKGELRREAESISGLYALLQVGVVSLTLALTLTLP